MNTAELLLQDLGIIHPRDIDLEALAFLMGVRIRSLPLEGCEARITGNGSKAIVAVNSNSSVERQRFSIGHELGHWHFHRNKLLMCQAADIGNPKAKQSEKVADRFSADLLMPRFLFDPLLRAQGKLSFKAIRTLAGEFQTSLTATAIRVAESSKVPALLICHGRAGREWFVRSPMIPDRWFPQEQLDPESPAFDVLFGGKGDDPLPQKMPADAWFDRSEAQYYSLREQSIRLGPDKILTLLIIDEDRMIEEVRPSTGWR